MPFAILDGVKTHYLVKGSGPHLLMMGSRGFNSTIGSWDTNLWQEMQAIDTFARHFTCIAYDRREAGLSGGRVEVLSYELWARQAKLLLEHLGVEKTWVLGPCMGVSVGLRFAAMYPESCTALMLPQPVGGWRWITKMQSLFDQHLVFVQEEGLEGVVTYAKKARKNFQEDGTVGPWGSVLIHDEAFVARFLKQEVEDYLDIVADSRDALYSSTFVCGATPRELQAMDMPAFVWAGDDASHSTSAAHQVRELMPRVRLWDLHPSKHTAANQLEELMRFRRDVDGGVFERK